jgi:hypothetical protein
VMFLSSIESAMFSAIHSAAAATDARRHVANSLRQMSVDSRFYMPDPELFGHPDAYALFTGFASRLEEAGLAGRFPMDVELRQIAIELLVERTTVEEVEADQSMIEHAISEAQGILDERRGQNAANDPELAS